MASPCVCRQAKAQAQEMRHKPLSPEQPSSTVGVAPPRYRSLRSSTQARKLQRPPSHRLGLWMKRTSRTRATIGHPSARPAASRWGSSSTPTERHATLVSNAAFPTSRLGRHQPRAAESPGSSAGLPLIRSSSDRVPTMVACHLRRRSTSLPPRERCSEAARSARRRETVGRRRA